MCKAQRQVIPVYHSGGASESVVLFPSHPDRSKKISSRQSQTTHTLPVSHLCPSALKQKDGVQSYIAAENPGIGQSLYLRP